MTNGKRRRLAKVARGGAVGRPDPLGSRYMRRRDEFNRREDARVERKIARLYPHLAHFQAPVTDAAADAAVE